MRVERKSQNGFTFVEVLVAIVILSIVVVGLASATNQGTKLSTRAQLAQRASVVLDGFADSITSMQYIPCAAPDDYSSQFAQIENELPDEVQRLLQSGNASVTVEAVHVHQDCTDYGDEPADEAIQRIELSSTYSTVTRSTTVIKRGTDALVEPAYADFDAELQSRPGSRQSLYFLTDKSYVPTGYSQIAWDCDTTDEYSDDSTDIELGGVESTFDCVYHAPYDTDTTIDFSVDETGRKYVVVHAKLTVWDRANPPFAHEVTKPIHVYATDAPSIPLDARFVISPSQEDYRTSDMMTFTWVGNPPQGADLVSWTWNFDDPYAGTNNSVQCETPCTPSHQFSQVGTYFVTLTLRDNWGNESVATESVRVVPGPVDNPIARISSSHTFGITPQTVTFNASASSPPAGETITQYIWNFGDGSDPVTTSDAIISKVYSDTPDSGFYRPTVTVVASNSGQSTAAVDIDIRHIQPPINFSVEDVHCSFLCINGGWIQVAWTNARLPAGETAYIRVQVAVQDGFGWHCGWFTPDSYSTFDVNAGVTRQSVRFDPGSLCPGHRLKARAQLVIQPPHEAPEKVSAWTAFQNFTMPWA